MRKTLWTVMWLVLLVGLVGGVSLARRQGLWTVDFTHKGFMSILVQGRQGPVAYYYIPCTVTNKTGQEVSIRPQGKVVTETGQTLYAAPAPDAALAICQRHERKMLDLLDMADQKIPDGESRNGLFIFTGLDDDADHLDVYLYGLSTEYKYTDEDNRTGFRRKVYYMKLSRPGDADNRHLDKVSLDEEGWRWVPTDVKAAAED